MKGMLLLVYIVKKIKFVLVERNVRYFIAALWKMFVDFCEQALS